MVAVMLGACGRTESTGDDGGESSAGDGAETGEIQLDMGLDEPERPDLSCEGAPPCEFDEDGVFLVRPQENVWPFQVLPTEEGLWLGRWDLEQGGTTDLPEYLARTDACGGEPFGSLIEYDGHGHNAWSWDFVPSERPLLVDEGPTVLYRRFEQDRVRIVRANSDTGAQLKDWWMPVVAFGMALADSDRLLLAAESGVLSLDLSEDDENVSTFWGELGPGEVGGRTLIVADGMVLFSSHDREQRSSTVWAKGVGGGAASALHEAEDVRWVEDFVADEEYIYWLLHHDDGDGTTADPGSIWRYRPSTGELHDLGLTQGAVPEFLAGAGEHLYYGTISGEVYALAKVADGDSPTHHRLDASSRFSTVYDGAADCTGLYVHGELAETAEQGVLALPLVEHTDG